MSSIRSTAHASYYELDRHLLNAGLRPANDAYVKFMVLARSRTGSTMLKTALKQHSEIVMYGELFREKPRWDPRMGLRRSQTAQLIFDDPQEFTRKVVFRKYPANTKAVGFKLFYFHAQNETGEEFWSHLRDDEALHIIHLRRWNILETYLSKQRALQSGKWVSKNAQESGAAANPNKERITLDYEECLQEFSLTRSREEYYSSYFAGHPTLNLWYKELVENYSENIQAVQDFLQVSAEPIVPLTRKQAKKSLSEQIANYEDLKRDFAGSEWAVFFEE